MSASLNSCPSHPCCVKLWYEMRHTEWRLFPFRCALSVQWEELQSCTPTCARTEKLGAVISIITQQFPCNWGAYWDTEPGSEKAHRKNTFYLAEDYRNIFICKYQKPLPSPFLKFLWIMTGITFRFNSLVCWRENYTSLKIWFHY